LKFGTNSPENFLAYNKFDATYPYDPEKKFPKTGKTLQGGNKINIGNAPNEMNQDWVMLIKKK